MKIITIIDKKIETKDVDSIELEFLQKIVGGYIEIPSISRKFNENRINVVMNEDGKFKNLYTSILLLSNGRIIDYIKGNVIFCSHDDDGETIGLTDEQIKIVKSELNNPLIHDGEIIYTIDL